MQNTNFNQLSKEIFEANVAVGWWDDMDRCIFQTLQLISTEIAEATEGERKNLMDDKLPHRRMGEVELADGLIRTLDFGGRYGFKYEFSGGTYKEVRAAIRAIPSIAGRHLMLNLALGNLARHYTDHRIEGDVLDIDEVNLAYTVLIDSFRIVAELQAYDLIGALHEKLAFNKQREDHKRENRAQEHGKKF